MATKSFKQITELDPKALMLVDSLNLAFRYKHSGALKFIDDYQRTVESLRKSYKCEKVIITCDQGSSSYRLGLDPLYKSERKEKQANNTEEEELAFQLFFEEFLRVIDKYREDDKFPVLQFARVEADDIAAYIVRVAKQYGVERIVLISTDRDWDLLIQDSVIRFSYITRKETRIDNWSEHYDWPLEHYVDIKCLQGDKGDSVPGVDKIGPKTALKLLNQYGGIFDIADSLPIPGKYVYIKNLNEFGKDRLLLNMQLMDLVSYCGDAIGQENCKHVEETLERYLND